MRLVDSHCHLDFERFDEDRQAVIARAFDAGLERMLVPGIDMPTSRAAVALAEDYPQVYAAVGIQPNSGMSWQGSTLKELEELAAHPKVVAIGEIGLDYYWDKTPKDLQADIFNQQLDLAGRLGLPVVIHNREATMDTISVLLRWQDGLAAQGSPLAERPGVLHSYSGDIIQAQPVLEAGFYLGISGPVTFKKADILRQVVSQAPLERLLIETDSPYLTPEPYRGKRNEPAYVRFVAQKIAELRNQSPDVVAQQTTENAVRLLSW